MLFSLFDFSIKKKETVTLTISVHKGFNDPGTNIETSVMLPWCYYNTTLHTGMTLKRSTRIHAEFNYKHDEPLGNFVRWVPGVNTSTDNGYMRFITLFLEMLCMDTMRVK